METEDTRARARNARRRRHCAMVRFLQEVGSLQVHGDAVPIIVKPCVVALYRDFTAAWAHASAIGADIRRTYAEMLTSPHSPQVIKKVLGALTLDVLALLSTIRSHEGPNPMADAIGAIEGGLQTGAHRRPALAASYRKALRHAPCRCSRSLYGPLLCVAPSLQHPASECSLRRCRLAARGCP